MPSRPDVRTAVVLAIVLVSVPALAQRRPRVARAVPLSQRVAIDLRARSFRVEHVWAVMGAARGELLAVRPRLTLREPAGPRWSGPGVRTRTNLTDDGVEATIDEPAMGRGTSRVTVGATRTRHGMDVTTVHEIGEYPLRLAEPELGSPWSPPTFGELSLTPARYTLATGHSELFDAGSALADAINEARRKWPGHL